LFEKQEDEKNRLFINQQGEIMEEKDKFLQDIIDKTAESLEFRAEFRANPKNIIEEKLRFRLPENMEIVVLEDSPDKIHIVLPSPPREELSEIELEAVSGGICWQDDCIASNGGGGTGGLSGLIN